MAKGRPTKLTKKLSESILSKLSEGEGLREICTSEAMPNRSTVFRWLRNNDDFRDQYARAREVQADALFEDILEIADNAENDWMLRNSDDAGYELNGEHIQRSKLRIDARKWMAGKLRPKVYGDKLELENNHSISDPLTSLLEKIGKQGRKITDG